MNQTLLAAIRPNGPGLIEDLETIGWGCYGEQAERYTFKDEPRASSFEELRSFLGLLPMNQPLALAPTLPDIR